MSLVAQALVNVAVALGATIGPMILGALTKRDPVNGWRDFWVRRSDPRFLLIVSPVEILTKSLPVDPSGQVASIRTWYLRRI